MEACRATGTERIARFAPRPVATRLRKNKHLLTGDPEALPAVLGLPGRGLRLMSRAEPVEIHGHRNAILSARVRGDDVRSYSVDGQHVGWKVTPPRVAVGPGSPTRAPKFIFWIEDLYPVLGFADGTIEAWRPQGVRRFELRGLRALTAGPGDAFAAAADRVVSLYGERSVTVPGARVVAALHDGGALIGDGAGRVHEWTVDGQLLLLARLGGAIAGIVTARTTEEFVAWTAAGEVYAYPEPGHIGAPHARVPHAVALHASAGCVAVADEAGVHVLDLAAVDRPRITNTSTPGGWRTLTRTVTHALAFDGPDRLLTAGDDHSIEVWELRTCKHLNRLTGHRAPVRGLFVDGPRILSWSDDRTIRLWQGTDLDVCDVFAAEERMDWMGVAPAGTFQSNEPARVTGVSPRGVRRALDGIIMPSKPRLAAWDADLGREARM